MQRKIIIIPQKPYGYWMQELGLIRTLFDAGECPEGFEKFCEDKDAVFWWRVSREVVEALRAGNEEFS